MRALLPRRSRAVLGALGLAVAVAAGVSPGAPQTPGVPAPAPVLAAAPAPVLPATPAAAPTDARPAPVPTEIVAEVVAEAPTAPVAAPVVTEAAAAAAPAPAAPVADAAAPAEAPAATAVRTEPSAASRSSASSAGGSATYRSTSTGSASGTSTTSADRPTRAPESGSPTPSTGSTLITFRLRYDEDKSIVAPHRYSVIVLQDYMRGSLPSLRSQAPATRFLAYKNAGSVNTDTTCAQPQTPSSGVTFCEADRNPDWFLYDSAGRRLVYADHSNLVALDPTNASYRNALAAGLAQVANTSQFAGVHLDDVNLARGHGLPDLYHRVNGKLVRLQDWEYAAGTVGMIAQVGDSLRAQGHVVTANVAMDPWNGTQMDQTLTMGRSLTAVSKEHFLRWRIANSQPFGGSTWDEYLTMFERLQAQGTPMLSETWGSDADRSVMEYTRASWLMGWDGKSRSAYGWETDAANDPWQPAWGTEIGSPTGPRSQVGSVWVRPYSAGKVVANPTTSSRTVALNGTYTRTDGTTVSGTVTLAPYTGLVLRSS